MHQRSTLVALAAAGTLNKSQLARLFGVSRKAVYKWLARAEAGEPLSDQSRRPHSHPDTTDSATVKRLLAARRKHPTWGARKLVDWLQGRNPELALPAPSTVTEILKRNGMVVARQRPRSGELRRTPQPEATEPNVVWSMDFKGDFRVGDGTRCFPLTVIDDYSRMALCCRAFSSTAEEPVRRALERTFRERGLPDRLRSDNGTPFGTKCMGPLSQLSVWLVKLGVRPEYTRPASPQDNPRIERFHRTLKHDTAFPPAASMAAQQRRFNRFVALYNDERPHEALEMLPPQVFYRPSVRPFPNRVEDPTYPGHYEVFRVLRPGYFSWKGLRHRVGSAFTGELVGVVEVDNGIREIYFGPLCVGVLDERNAQPRVLPMFPV